MDISNRIKNALAAFKKTSNSGPDASAYLRYGPRRTMSQTWSTPEITDTDFYTGYGFAVINKRANRSVVLGKKFLYTDAKETIIEKANKDGVAVTHPYINLIRDSIDFSERDFWYDISTYLDLEGVYYLMAVRTVRADGGVGNIQKLVLMNPYNIRPIIDSRGVLGGYVEQHNDLQRDIPKEMIIPIKLLNPFDQNRAFSLADAARDSQFTMKQANDFAREAIDGNLNAPGILSSAIELPDDQFDNFVERVKHHGRGEPLFGNGAGTVSWVDMQTDLDKAALDKINSINRDTLLAISGLSKTGVGVEESGTGREVSRTQKDDFTENAVMPQVENIIDALNLDYRRYYETNYRNNGYAIVLDNPLETNRDAEQADVDIRNSQFDLLKSLLAEGYVYDIASKYSKGLIDITALGEAPEKEVPVIEPVVPPVVPDPPVEPKSYLEKTYHSFEGYPIPVVQYLEELGDQIDPLSEKSSLIYSTKEGFESVRMTKVDQLGDLLIGVVNENTYIRLAEFHAEADRVAILSKLNKRYKNQIVAVKKKLNLTHNVYEVIKSAAFDKAAQIDGNTADILSSAVASQEKIFNWYTDELAKGNSNPKLTDLDQFINSLALPFAVYFTVMFPIYASYRVQETAKNLNVNDEIPVIAMTEEVKQRIKDFARKEANSHVNTIKTDIENALSIIRAKTSDPQEMRTMFQLAFADIQKRRSLTLADSAASRIFNISQYEADLQFLTRAGLVKQAFKELFSLSGDPCSICVSIIASSKGKPVPFTDAFADLGDTIVTDDLKMTFSYEQITAGNVHPNCHCAYRLIVKDVA